MKKNFFLSLALAFLVATAASGQTNVIYVPIADVGLSPQAGGKVQVQLVSPLPR